jgi:hypothetical protein
MQGALETRGDNAGLRSIGSAGQINGVSRFTYFTYDLFEFSNLSEFERRGPWFAKSSEPPNCC